LTWVQAFEVRLRRATSFCRGDISAKILPIAEADPTGDAMQLRSD